MKFMKKYVRTDLTRNLHGNKNYLSSQLNSRVLEKKNAVKPLNDAFDVVIIIR